MTDMPSREQILEKARLVRQRIHDVHIKQFPDQPGPVFLISNAYPGVWLEHVYDAISFARLEPAMAHIARNQVLLFLRNQKPYGRLPFQVIDMSNPRSNHYKEAVGYNQIQECVSFARLCLEAAQLTGDRALLEEAYAGCAKWDDWQCQNRMTLNTGLIELFCLYDTGHDHSARLDGIPVKCPDDEGRVCADHPALPILAPDMNAVFYGSRKALAEMAELLGKPDEAAQWWQKAETVKQAMLARLYDAQDEFFYDADKNGNHRKFRSIHISNVLSERVPDEEMAQRIYERHMKNPKEFWTPYPFPSMSISDPGSKQDRDGNSWGFYSQGLTTLRAMRWMDDYGHGDDLEYLMSRWVKAFTESQEMNFSQELHPITGKLSRSSEWYSSSMLVFLHAIRRLGYES